MNTQETTNLPVIEELMKAYLARIGAIGNTPITEEEWMRECNTAMVRSE